MNIQGLIERYEKFKSSKKKLTSVDLVLKDLRALDDPEPLPFKLKDVIGRIRGFDPTTQTRWLNDIIKELGYSQSLIKKWECLEVHPNLYNVEGVATYFDLPVNVFIGEE